MKLFFVLCSIGRLSAQGLADNHLLEWSSARSLIVGAQAGLSHDDTNESSITVFLGKDGQLAVSFVSRACVLGNLRQGLRVEQRADGALRIRCSSLLGLANTPIPREGVLLDSLGACCQIWSVAELMDSAAAQLGLQRDLIRWEDVAEIEWEALYCQRFAQKNGNWTRFDIQQALRNLKRNDYQRLVWQRPTNAIAIAPEKIPHPVRWAFTRSPYARLELRWDSGWVAEVLNLDTKPIYIAVEPIAALAHKFKMESPTCFWSEMGVLPSLYEEGLSDFMLDSLVFVHCIAPKKAYRWKIAEADAILQPSDCVRVHAVCLSKSDFEKARRFYQLPNPKIPLDGAGRMPWRVFWYRDWSFGYWILGGNGRVAP